MVTLTKDRNTTTRDGGDFNHPVAAATIIFAGSIACLNAARDAVPGSTSTTLVAIGRAEEYVDNSGGAAGDLTISVRKGVFHFANDGSIARADIGGNAYIVDDQTVADTDGTGTRSLAGEIVDVDADGVWVKIG